MVMVEVMGSGQFWICFGAVACRICLWVIMRYESQHHTVTSAMFSWSHRCMWSMCGLMWEGLTLGCEYRWWGSLGTVQQCGKAEWTLERQPPVSPAMRLREVKPLAKTVHVILRDSQISLYCEITFSYWLLKYIELSAHFRLLRCISFQLLNLEMDCSKNLWLRLPFSPILSSSHSLLFWTLSWTVS